MPFPVQPPSYPDLNGRKPDFYSIQIIIPGLYVGDPPVGLTSISFSDTLESGKLRGNSPIMIGKSRGKYSAKASAEMYLEDAYTLVNWLGQQGAALGMGAYEYPWSLDLAFSFPGSDLGLTHTAQIVGVRLAGIDDDYKEGQDPLKCKINLDDPFMIVRDGVAPFQPSAPFWPISSV